MEALLLVGWVVMIVASQRLIMYALKKTNHI